MPAASICLKQAKYSLQKAVAQDMQFPSEADLYNCFRRRFVRGIQARADCPDGIRPALLTRR